MAENEPQYAKSAAQVDLEARVASGNKSDRVLSTSDSYEKPESGDGRSYAVEGNDLTGYVGVSPEYATYSTDAQKPSWAEDSAETTIAEQFVEAVGDAALLYDEDESEDDESEGDKPEDKKPAAKKTASSTSNS